MLPSLIRNSSEALEQKKNKPLTITFFHSRSSQEQVSISRISQKSRNLLSKNENL